MIENDVWARVYAKLPVWAQHGAVTAFGAYWHWLRFGPGFEGFVREYRQRERFDATQWQAWQSRRLQQVLSMASQYVPYYRAQWSQTEHRAARAGRLVELPLLDKEPVRRAPFEFVRNDARRRRLVFHTSGSTGTPIASVWTIPEIRASRALREVRSAGWAGVSFAQGRTTFSGRVVEPDIHSRGPFYRYNAVERHIYFSAFHLKPATAEHYVDALWRHRPTWLTGYAFSYYLLAKYILELGLRPPPLRAVVATSEKVTQPMRDVMQRAFGCRVFEEYSTVEQAVFASECEAGGLHVSPDACLLEILRSDGSPCRPGEIGEVVATNLLRVDQPFVRFRLGDLAAWAPNPCPCGRAMPVLQEVVGRLDDVLTGPDGRQVVRFNGVFADLSRVIEAQIIQEAPDRIRVKIVPHAGFAPTDSEEIVRRVKQRLGTAVSVEVERVATIPRTHAGKFRAVISQLNDVEPQLDRFGGRSS